MEPVRFEDLGVDERILRAVTEMGFEACAGNCPLPDKRVGYSVSR